MRLSLAEVARATGGVVEGADPGSATDGVAIDSRLVLPGELFVALPGAHADGHDFVAAATAAGAAASLVGHPVPGAGPQVVVADPLAALQALAACIREAVPHVVGITGSTGKTSTKDLLASVAATRYATVAATRSYNNELGVALTLAACGRDTQVAVCEMGARGPGQIAALCRLARPTVAVVTNVGVSHYEQFGSVEAIARTKGELPASLPAEGTAVLNADDERVAAMAARTAGRVVTYGLGPAAEVRGEDVAMDAAGRAAFVLVAGGEAVAVRLAMAGRHQVANALAAAAAGLALGCTLGEVAAGLSAAQGSPWRMDVTEQDGVVVVNDAYNANPTSVRAALETCAAMVPPGGRLLAVLGGMAELGEIEGREHHRIGLLAGSLATRLVTVGDAARPAAAGAREAGLADVVEVDGADQDALLAALGSLRPGDVVLVKASRVAGLERLAVRLTGGALR